VALPTLAKSWDFSKVNQSFKESSTFTICDQKLLFAIKEAIKSWTGWTVKGSSDSVTAGMDGVDRWTDYTKLVWSSNFSWIVLERTAAGGAGKDFELLIVCTNSNAQYGSVHGSWAGFTGGTINTAPTATDTYQFVNANYWCNTFGVGVGFDCVLQAFTSTDGAVNRLVVLQNNTPVLYACFETINNPVAGWTHPFVACWYPNRDLSLGSFTDNARLIAYDANAPAGWFANYMTCESHVAATTPERTPYLNQFSLESPLYLIGIASTAANKRGRHGQLYDIWWGSPTRLIGDTYPEGGTGAFVNIGGNLVLPWNGSVYLPL